MPTPKLSDELLQEAVDTLAAHGGNKSAAARALGLHRCTFISRIKEAEHRKIAAPEPPSIDFDYPAFPDDDTPIEDVIEHMCKRFETRRASHAAHTWFPIAFKSDKPIGVLWWGDPHIDDNGANLPLIRRYAELSQNNDALYSVNIGDTTNNWAGRLMGLYAEQDTSLKTARRLAEWLMLDSGVKWLVWLLGNHDAWGDGAAILAQMIKRHNTHKIVCHDWEARFSLTFPNGRACRVHAAHDFKGHSQWNNMHGLLKAAKMGEEADIYVAGHKHTWGVLKEELAERGGVFPTLLRVRGFKHMDDYARRHGFADESEGAAILTIIDPNAKSRSAFVRVEMDVEAGVEYLEWLRSR